MRKTLLLAVLTLSTTVATTSLAGDDELFSKVRLNSTSDSAGTAPSPSQTERPQRRPVSDASTLQSLLLAAGYSARIDDNQTISIDLSRSDWSAAVSMTLDDAGRQLQLTMQLTQPEANTVIAPKTLRGMLEANRTNKGVFFAIAGEPQHIELVKSITSQGLDSELLQRELDAMADMAESTKEIWKTAGVRIRQASTTETESTPAATTPATTTTPAATTPAATTPTLTGKWISTPSTNEAFALQIDAGSSFKLVHVKGTQSTKSQGTWALSGTTLSLKGDDGTTITGTIARQSDSFTLTMAGAGGKSVSLTFKSST